MTDKLTKLEKLLIGEVSGVDDPANELPGHMVLKSVTPAEAPSIVGQLKKLLTGKEEVEMEKAELLATLSERDDALVTKFADAVVKALAPEEVVPAPVAVAPVPAVATPTEPLALTAEDVVKAVEEANAPLLEVIDKTLDRVEKLELGAATSARKSLDGQEGEPAGDGIATTPTVSEAIAKALRTPQTVVAAA